MPSLWWPATAPLYAGGKAGPDLATRRQCGCHSDPVVFGHWHLNGCQFKAVTP